MKVVPIRLVVYTWLGGLGWTWLVGCLGGWLGNSKSNLVGWRLAGGEDGRGWPTRVSQEIPTPISHAKLMCIAYHLITSRF